MKTRIRTKKTAEKTSAAKVANKSVFTFLIAITALAFAACGKPSSHRYTNDSTQDPLLSVYDNGQGEPDPNATPDPEEKSLLDQLLQDDSNSNGGGSSTDPGQNPTPSAPSPTPFPRPTPEHRRWPTPPPVASPQPSEPTPLPSETPGQPTDQPPMNPPKEPSGDTPGNGQKPPVHPPSASPTPAPTPVPRPPKATPTPRPGRPQTPIRGFWEDASKDGREWTAYAIDAINRYGRDLLKTVPEDIKEFCPPYANFDSHSRQDFWVKLLSAIAAAESRYKPNVTYTESFNDRAGHAVVSRGLLQISMESANGYGCGIDTPSDLDDPQTNIECGIRIMNRWVAADSVISDSDKDGWYGPARYWSTLRDFSKQFPVIKQLLRRSRLCTEK